MSKVILLQTLQIFLNPLWCQVDRGTLLILLPLFFFVVMIAFSFYAFFFPYFIFLNFYLFIVIHHVASVDDLQSIDLFSKWRWILDG